MQITYAFQIIGLFPAPFPTHNSFFFMLRFLTYKDLHSLNHKSPLAPNTCPAKHDKGFFPYTVFWKLAQSVAICLAHELQVHGGWQRLFGGQN